MSQKSQTVTILTETKNSLIWPPFCNPALSKLRMMGLLRLRTFEILRISRMATTFRHNHHQRLSVVPLQM